MTMNNWWQKSIIYLSCFYLLLACSGETTQTQEKSNLGDKEISQITSLEKKIKDLTQQVGDLSKKLEKEEGSTEEREHKPESTGEEDLVKQEFNEDSKGLCIKKSGEKLMDILGGGVAMALRETKTTQDGKYLEVKIPYFINDESEELLYCTLHCSHSSDGGVVVKEESCSGEHHH